MVFGSALKWWTLFQRKTNGGPYENSTIHLTLYDISATVTKVGPISEGIRVINILYDISSGGSKRGPHWKEICSKICVSSLSKKKKGKSSLDSQKKSLLLLAKSSLNLSPKKKKKKKKKVLSQVLLTSLSLKKRISYKFSLEVRSLNSLSKKKFSLLSL